jgi:hypothetical protein
VGDRMSRIRIYGDTSGYIDIKAPDVSSNTEVEIPEGGFVGQDEFTSSLAEKAPSASPTFTGTVGLPLTTNYDGTQLSTTLGSKLDVAGGKILQVVTAPSDSTQRSTTSTSPVDVTSMSITITPQKTDSAVIIVATFLAQAELNSGTADAAGFFSITDSSNNAIGDASTDLRVSPLTAAAFLRTRLTILGYATPEATSAVTWKLRFFVPEANRTAFVLNNLAPGRMYALEVSA